MPLSVLNFISSEEEDSDSDGNTTNPDFNRTRSRDTQYSEMSNEDFFGVEVPDIDPESDGRNMKAIDNNKIQAIRSESSGPYDGYQLDKSTFVTIEREPQTGYLFYVVHEPKLFPEEEQLLEEVSDPVYDALERKPADSFKSDEEKIEFIETEVSNFTQKFSLSLPVVNKIRKFLNRDIAFNIDDEGLNNIKYYINREKVMYSKITPLLKDNKIEDITCPLGPNSPVFVYHEDYGYIVTNIAFEKTELDNFVRSLSNRGNKTISKSDPILDASLPDGSRLHAQYQTEVTPNGTTFTIRQMNDELLTPVDLIKFGTFNARQMAFKWLAVEHKKGVFAAGGTGAGKTTTLNADLLFKPPEEKAVSIEDTPELTLNESNWTNLVTRDGLNEDDSIDMDKLFTGALRMRPIHIPVGEVRNEVVQSAFEAMNSDHTVYATFHAQNMDTIISRLESNGVTEQEQFTLDLVCFQEQMQDGSRRVTELIEVESYDSDAGELKTNVLWEWNPFINEYEFNLDDITDSNIIQEIMGSTGKNKEDIHREIEARVEILEYLVENDIEDSNKVTEMLNSFYRHKANGDTDDPYDTKTLKQIQNDEVKFITGDSQ